MVRYTDYVIARGLINVVDDWYDSSDDRDVWIPTPSMKFMYMEHAFDPFGPSGIFLKAFPLIIAGVSSLGLIDNLPFVDFSNPYHAIGMIVCSLLIYYS